jgi:hypothetical protein
MTTQPWLEFHEEPVTLHSGARSHWLVRGDLIFADERLREAVLDYWGFYIAGLRPPYFFWAIPRGGSAWAEAIAERVGGTWANRPGPASIPNNATVLAVDDVATTGRSLLDYGASHNLIVVDRRQRVAGVLRTWCWASLYLPLLEPHP